MKLWQLQTLVINGIVALAFLAYGSYTALEQSAFEQEQILQDARNLALSIAAGSADDILSADFDRIENRLLRQVKLSSVRELLITDVQGRVLSQVRRLADGSAQPVYEQLTLQMPAVVAESTGDDAYMLELPIERGALLGHLRLTAGLERLAEVRAHIWRDTLEILAVTILVLGLLQTLVFRRIGGTLETVADFADDLIHQRGAAIDAKSRIFELRRLKSALNQVSVALADQHQTLVESEARKGAFLEASLDALITVDEAGHIVEFNRAAERIFGHRREAALDRKMGEMIIPHRFREAHDAGMRHYLATGEGPVLGKRLELSALREGGEEFPVELTIVPFTLQDRKFFLGALRDITDRRELERQREQADNRLRAALSELDARDRALERHAIVSVTDLQGRITFANRMFSEVSGYTNAELVGRNHRILKSGLHEPRFYTDLWTTIARGETWQGEIANRRRDGSVYWVKSTIVPVLDGDGLPQQYIAVRTDISEQKRVASELAEARARELAVGLQIQRTLLTGRIPQRRASASLAMHSEPSAGIDGDFHDYREQGATGFDLVVGDVMGKGVPAALIGAGVKQELARVASCTQVDRPGPEVTVNLLNRELFGGLLELDSFVTLAYLRFEPERERITYVDAGHTKAIFAGADGTRLLAGDNVPLGVLEQEHFRQHVTGWHPGDMVVLYSDGLTEAMNAQGEMFGVERLAQMVGELRAHRVPVAVVVQAVRKAIDLFTDGEPLRDDYTCLAVELERADDRGEPPVQLELRWRLDELARLRDGVAQAATAMGLDRAACDALVLGASETAANIFRHAPEPRADATAHVRIEARDGRVRVTFHYLGVPFSPAVGEPDFSGQRTGGFGLYIVRNSVDDVGYDEIPHGVWRIRLCKDLGGSHRP